MLLNKIRIAPLLISASVAVVNALVVFAIVHVFNSNLTILLVASISTFVLAFLTALAAIAMIESAASADDAMGIRFVGEDGSRFASMMATSTAISANEGSEPHIDMAEGKSKVVLCGSMSAMNLIEDLSSQLQENGFDTIVPSPDVTAFDTGEDYREYKSSVARTYMNHIATDDDVIAVVAVNPTRHDVDGYIGPNTFAELVIAFYAKKRMFTYYPIPASYADELSSWGAISLDGDVLNLSKHLE